MSDGLEDLLRRAWEAEPGPRIEYRDAIAAHGTTAIPKIASWLSDLTRAAFAFGRLSGHRR